MTATKTRFTRDMITDAAFNVTRRDGWHAVSARTIARELGSSTQPLYSHLHSMKELTHSVRIKAYLLLSFFLVKSSTAIPFLDEAQGYLAFSHREPHLFRFLFLEEETMMYKGEAPLIQEELKEHLDDPFPALLLFALHVHSEDHTLAPRWIFVHGLATALANRSIAPLKPEEVTDLLFKCNRAFR